MSRPRPRISRRALSLALAAVASGQAVAQTGTPAERKPGTVDVRAHNHLGATVSPAAARQAAFAGADRITALVLKAEGISHPVGYYVTLRPQAGVSVSGPSDAPVPGAPPEFGVVGTLNYYAMESDGHGGEQVTEAGGRVTFSVLANPVAPRPENDRLPQAPDGGPPVFALKQTGEFRGRPIYDRDCTYVTHGTTLPFVPFTKDRFLRNKILVLRTDSARHAAQMAASGAAANTPEIQEIIRQGNETVGAAVRDLEHQLSSLSSDERREPVSIHLGGPFGDWDFEHAELASSSDEDAWPVMEWNPSFFDRTLPPGVPQVIWVCLPGLQDGVPPLNYNWNAQRARDAARLRDQLDWAALERMVQR